MTKVYFFSEVEKLSKALDLIGIGDFNGIMVPIKLHMGEIGNRYYISPSFIKLVVDKLWNIGAEPFLFDTTVDYRGPRSTRYGYQILAYKHGFRRDTMGCEVVIGEEGVRIIEHNCVFYVAREIHESTHLVVVSHVKGHVLTGFGGAIKNLGMGGVAKNTKRLVHSWSTPRYLAEKCDLCGMCAEVCPPHAMIVDSAWRYNTLACVGCGKCVSVCPRGSLKYRVMDLQRGIALAAKACSSEKKTIYINVLLDITRSCDCESAPGPIICPDIGYLVSDELAVIDKASLELIEDTKPGIFEETHRVDPFKQVKYLQEIGFNCSYDIVTL